MKHIIAAAILSFSTGAIAGEPRHSGDHRHNGNGWVVPLVGGMIIGSMVTREYTLQPPPVYVPPVQVPPPIYLPPVYVQPPVYIPPQPRHTMCLVQMFDPATNSFRNEPVPCIKYQ